MNRPLLITDCDEVLLHMVTHFAEWLRDAHDLHFSLDTSDFSRAIRSRTDGELVPPERIWPLLDSFFDSEMHRQNIVPGALEALEAIGREADIVVLTNLGDKYHSSRVEQLEAVGIRHRVLCNRGGKGKPVVELIEELDPPAAVFVDDLAGHHASVADEAPLVWRLHMIAEPRLARHMPPAPAAHARIDDWNSAQAWILDRLREGPAPIEKEIR